MFVRVSRWDILQAPGKQDMPSQSIKNIPASAKRRLNSYGRHAAGLAADKIEESPLIVFASRYGDVERSLRILEEISQGESLSPMNFSLSVHNAVPGVLSIAWQLKEMQSVISAGSNTFVMGLTEAFSLLHTFPQKSVLLIYVDLPLPPVFSNFGDLSEATEVCSLLLQNCGGDSDGEGIILQVELEPRRGLASSGKSNPLGVLSSMLSGAEKKAVVGTETLTWRLERQDA